MLQEQHAAISTNPAQANTIVHGLGQCTEHGSAKRALPAASSPNSNVGIRYDSTAYGMPTEIHLPSAEKLGCPSDARRVRTSKERDYSVGQTAPPRVDDREPKGAEGPTGSPEAGIIA